MKRNLVRCFAVMVMAGVMGLGALGQTPPSPEAVAAMKAKLAALKKEAAELEAKIAAAEAPVPGAEVPVIVALNAMPRNLWPGDSDSDMKTALREKWLTENIKPGVAGTFTGTIIVATSSTLYPAGKPAYEGVHVVLDCGRHVVWGKETDLKVIAVLENVTPPDTLEWGEKKAITVTGTSKNTRTTNPVEVTLETAKMK